jgi:hypothetical protein
MIKCGRLPGRCVMTLGAGMCKLIGHMIGAGGIIEIGLMAGKAIRRQAAAILPVCVAANATRRRMRAGEREGRVCMIKRGWLPGCGIMTLRADMRKLIGHMIGAGRIREIGLMTGITIRCQAAAVLPVCVAANAIGRRMRAC